MLPPSAALSSAATGLTELIGKWDSAAAKTLFDSGVNIDRTQKLFALTAEQRGACRVEQPVGGDGKRKARLRLACDRYPVVLDFALSEKDEKKVGEVRFMPVPFRGGRCLQ